MFLNAAAAISRFREAVVFEAESCLVPLVPVGYQGRRSPAIAKERRAHRPDRSRCARLFCGFRFTDQGRSGDTALHRSPSQPVPSRHRTVLRALRQLIGWQRTCVLPRNGQKPQRPVLNQFQSQWKSKIPASTRCGWNSRTVAAAFRKGVRELLYLQITTSLFDRI